MWNYCTIHIDVCVVHHHHHFWVLWSMWLILDWVDFNLPPFRFKRGVLYLLSISVHDPDCIDINIVAFWRPLWCGFSRQVRDLTWCNIGKIGRSTDLVHPHTAHARVGFPRRGNIVS